MRRSSARYTTPIPPRPRTPVISYLPIFFLAVFTVVASTMFRQGLRQGSQPLYMRRQSKPSAGPAGSQILVFNFSLTCTITVACLHSPRQYFSAPTTGGFPPSPHGEKSISNDRPPAPSLHLSRQVSQ